MSHPSFGLRLIPRHLVGGLRPSCLRGPGVPPPGNSREAEAAPTPLGCVTRRLPRTEGGAEGVGGGRPRFGLWWSWSDVLAGNTYCLRGVSHLLLARHSRTLKAKENENEAHSLAHSFSSFFPFL